MSGPITRADIVTAGRRHLGTPFRHQGRQPGRGLDCAGIIACIARDLGLSHYDVTNYPRLPQGDSLIAHLRSAGLSEVPVQSARPGDVLVLRFKTDPQHLGLMTDRGILHAYYGAGAVVEHRLDPIWRARLVAAFQFKGIV